MISIWHLLWIAPLCGLIGYAFKDICIRIDVHRAIMYGEPLEVCGVLITNIEEVEEDDEDL